MNDYPKIRVWITKYALTVGLYEADCFLCGDGMVKTDAEWSQYFHGEGKDWHRTRESALARCEVMRKAKLASIEKSRKKIEALRFDAM